MTFTRAFRIGLFALAATLAWSQPEKAEEKETRWFEAQSPHFLVYTDTSEAKARRLLEDFEGRVAALESAIGPVPDRQFPVEIFLFNKGADFAEVAGPEAERAAYLFHGLDRIFIAARDKSPEDVAADAGHALGHVLFERVVLWRPFWMAEGAAEYFRKAGRKADLKTVSKADGFSVRDLLRIVSSSGYHDSDPPTAFRMQAHRLLRLIAEKHPETIRPFLGALRTEGGQNAKPNVDANDLASEFEAYEEMPIPLTPRPSGIRTGPADAVRVAIHRGDLLVAASRPDQAGIRYNSVSESGTKEARAARAIFTRFSRNPAEASRVMERAARELPDRPLVLFHFGSIEVASPPDLLEAQTGALERAVQAFPLLGRAHAELARLYTLTGHPERAMPLLDKAMVLEPEFGDRFVEIRAQTLLALHRLDEARDSMKTASALPHAEERRDALYEEKIRALETRVENLRRETEGRQVEKLRETVDRAAALFDPPPPARAAPPPLRQSSMEYSMESVRFVGVVNAVYPDFPEELLESGKGADLAFEILVGTDGRVARITPGTSSAPDLTASTVAAIRRWTFNELDTPATVKLTFRYVVEEVERK